MEVNCVVCREREPDCGKDPFDEFLSGTSFWIFAGLAGSPEDSVLLAVAGFQKCHQGAIGVTTSDNALWEKFGAGLLGALAFLILLARRDPQRVLCFGLSLEPKSATTQPSV